MAGKQVLEASARVIAGLVGVRDESVRGPVHGQVELATAMMRQGSVASNLHPVRDGAPSIATTRPLETDVHHIAPLTG